MQPASIVNPGAIEEAHIHVMAAVIWHRRDERQFLIAQRQKGKHLQDLWEFPGGKLEAGETPWQALKREIAEEISLQLTRGSPYMQVYHRYTERNVLLDIWTVEEYRGEVEPREQQAVRWIGVDEIENYCFPPADMPVLQAIRRNATIESRRSP